MVFKRDDITSENIYFKENVEEGRIPNASKINLSMSFLTPYATEQMKKEYVGFQMPKYTKKETEIFKVNSLGVDVYFVPFDINMHNEMYNVEHITIAHFIYDNVLYTVTGNWVSENAIKDFIKTLH